MTTKQERKPIILTFVSFYLPGYKAGGPIRTIANMVAHLSDEFEFWIVTRDRDLGDSSSYPGINVNAWQQVENAKIFYISPQKESLVFISRLLAKTPYDILYLNSFFDLNYTVKPLLAVGWIGGEKPVIVAPRGELSLSALKLKKIKKKVGMQISKLLGLYKRTYFQASSCHEMSDIVAALGPLSTRVKVAIDLPEKRVSSEYVLRDKVNTDLGTIKVVFISRISPMKNLDFALQVLAMTKSKVYFDIYGPVEDVIYWSKCQKLMENLPGNVVAQYIGSVAPHEIGSTFAQYDLFLFPTRGENYGHVIAESISVGTPVLISDRTPWRNLEDTGLGWVAPLSSPSTFAERIDEFAALTGDERQAYCLHVQQQACMYLLDPQAIEANRRMFRALRAKSPAIG